MRCRQLATLFLVFDVPGLGIRRPNRGRLRERATQLVQRGEPETIIDVSVPPPLTTPDRLFTARSYVDKYGPADRYDDFAHLPSVRVPLLLTLGSLEDTLTFQPLAVRGPSLHERVAARPVRRH